MTNAQTTIKFFAATDAKTCDAILSNIAKNYGITIVQAGAEIMDEDAENLLDYMTGPERAATSLLMNLHQIAR